MPAQYHALDLAALVALLMPLMGIGWCAGTAAGRGVLWWTLWPTAYAGFWAGMYGALARLPLTSAAALLAGLIIWLLLPFAVPAWKPWPPRAIPRRLAWRSS